MFPRPCKWQLTSSTVTGPDPHTILREPPNTGPLARGVIARMTTHHQRTPWPTSDVVVVTDAGLETWLVFDHHIDLPAFAAYPLAAAPAGRALLIEYYDCYAAIARTINAAVVLETPTWRANPDWAATLGHDRAALAEFIAAGVSVVAEVRNDWTADQPFLIGGTVGPRGDGYRIDSTMNIDTACDYHSFQIGCMADAGVDIVTALTMGYIEEAAGIARAAETVGLPVIVSFTVETNGRLPSGMSLGEAIETTDAMTSGYPTHYMINCAHPTHFDHALDRTAPWVTRIGGLRANASQLSHAELDDMVELDAGDPADLATRYVELRAALPKLHVIGGCCGTDHRHVAAIATAWTTTE
jgi:homocysteine S-methyltransferase